jgi:hypothetical protein
MVMTTLTLMFPDDNGIELTVTFEQDEQFVRGIDVQKICLAGERTDFSEWLSDSAIDLIERMISRENDSLYLASLAVDYENAA